MHELTKQIIKHYEERKCLIYSITDSIITTYLREKAKELSLMPFDKIVRLGSTKSFQFLGLSPLEPEKPKQEEWCEHIKYSEDRFVMPFKRPIHDEDMFCCICGAPRPIKKNLRDGLADKIEEVFAKHNVYKADSIIDDLADTAIQFLKERGEK